MSNNNSELSSFFSQPREQQEPSQMPEIASMKTYLEQSVLQPLLGALAATRLSLSEEQRTLIEQIINFCDSPILRPRPTVPQDKESITTMLLFCSSALQYLDGVTQLHAEHHTFASKLPLALTLTYWQYRAIHLFREEVLAPAYQQVTGQHHCCSPH